MIIRHVGELGAVDRIADRIDTAVGGAQTGVDFDPLAIEFNPGLFQLERVDTRRTTDVLPYLNTSGRVWQILIFFSSVQSWISHLWVACHSEFPVACISEVVKLSTATFRVV
jgi:hypothetical protein